MLPRTTFPILIIVLSVLMISAQSHGVIPTRLVIPAIGLDSPIVPVGKKVVVINPDLIGYQWLVDETRVGWHNDSAKFAEPENMVLNGHGQNGGVFGKLDRLIPNDTITVWAGLSRKEYRITQIIIIKEDGQSIDQRQKNGRLIEPTGDERVTMITCLPQGWRLIIVAK